MKLETALAQLARETTRMHRRMAQERALRASLPVLGAALAWASLALAGVQAALPWAAQSLASLAALVLCAILTLRARRAWRRPSEDEARNRLAMESRVEQGALEVLRDRPVHYEAAAAALWRRARQRSLDQVAKLRAGPLRPALDEVDPRRLRYVLAAAFLAALVFAGAAAPERLARAFLPDPGPLLGDRPIVVEAWASPADYTHAAPISLSDRLGQTVATAPTIEVTVRATGPAGAPRLVFRGEHGRRETRFARAADGAWEARLALPGPGRLSIVRFYERGFWRMAPAADSAPKAAFIAPVANLPAERAALAWRASDDFGLEGLRLRVKPIAPPPGLARADPFDSELEIPVGAPRAAEAEAELELAAHPYAGMEVEARLVAVDALGQEGVSEPLRFTMPEHLFLQPLSRAAIEIRRQILAERRPYRAAAQANRRSMPDSEAQMRRQRIEVRDFDARAALTRAPEGVRRAARLLDALTADAQDGYFRDPAVYLGLRLARSELAVSENTRQTDLAAATLWHVAQRAEYGGGADTRRALEESQSQLSQALQRPDARQSARERIEALRRATERYLESLTQEALRNGGAESAEDTRERTEITESDIERALDNIERLTEQGRTEEARAASEALTDTLQNLDVQLQQADEAQRQQQRAQQESENLSEVMQQQQSLSEETERERQEQQQQENSQGGSGGERQGGQGGDELAERQAQISESLAQTRDQSQADGEAAQQALDAAGEAMRRSENALRRGDFEGARAAQDAALGDLQRGAAALSGEAGQPNPASAEGETQSEVGSSDQIDPLGRGANGGEDWQSGQGNGDPSRTRALFDDIVRRAQDPNRPEAEREYLRRLLDRFGEE
ncbi:MAG: DUF4175 family protein [Terricaulis sp.]